MKPMRKRAAVPVADLPSYQLRLFVSGATARSTHAIANIRDICERKLAGRYQLEVIDVYQQPELAASEQLVALPTLVRFFPLPIRHLIGDLSDEARVLGGLDLPP